MDQKNKLEVCGRNVDWKYNPWFGNCNFLNFPVLEMTLSAEWSWHWQNVWELNMPVFLILLNLGFFCNRNYLGKKAYRIGNDHKCVIPWIFCYYFSIT